MLVRHAFYAGLLAALCLWPAFCSAQVVLRPNYIHSDEYRTTEQVKSNQALILAGQSLDTSAEQTAGVRYRIGPADASGQIPVSIKFEELATRMSLPGGVEVAFDSQNDDGTSDESLPGILQGAMRAMHGAELSAAVNGDGRVLSFTGGAAVLEKMAEPAKSLFGGQLDDNVLKRELQQSIDRFPAEPVKPGDAWQRTHVLDAGQGQQLVFDERLEYVGPVERNGRTLHHVRPQVTAVRYTIPENANSPFKLKDSDLKVESSSGDLYVDATKGRLIARNEKLRVKGTFTLVGNGMDLPATLDLTIETVHQEE